MADEPAPSGSIGRRFGIGGAVIAVLITLLNSPVVASCVDWLGDWYRPSALVQSDHGSPQKTPISLDTNALETPTQPPIDFSLFPALSDRADWNIHVLSCGGIAKHNALVAMIDRFGFSQASENSQVFENPNDVFDHPSDFAISSRVHYYNDRSRRFAQELARSISASPAGFGEFVALPGDTGFGVDGGENKLIVHAVFAGCER